MMDKPMVAISTDFLTSFASLPKQKQGKATEFFNKFRTNPNSPGINYEKIDEGIDKNICSVRIDDTYRAIVVRCPDTNVYMLLWVDHHDEAYAWAKRKKCSINKVTGGVQVFDVQEVAVEKQVEKETIFAAYTYDQLIRMGLPEEQIPMIKSIETMDEFYAMKKSIPEDAYEGLEWLAHGFDYDEVIETLYEDEAEPVKEDNFAAALQSDSSKKSFVIVDGEEELKRIMAEPLEKWRIFLHPTQRKIVNRDYSGPARVLGGAGTGKTVVAMHRAKRLASDLPLGKRVLFTTYTRNLADDIRENLRKIASMDQMKKIEVINLDAWVASFLRDQGYEYNISYGDELDKIWNDAIAQAGGLLDYTKNFYIDEWIKVVQAQEAYTKEKYIKASRIGRGLRLDRIKRMKVWGVFEEYMNLMDEKKLRDSEFAMYECRIILEKQFSAGRYESIIVDEGQDLSPSAFRLIRALAGEAHKNDIFIVGDAHQRIYRNKAILSKCGINVRGRARKLRINYRTTEEIRKYAFGLLKGVSFDDMDEEYDDGDNCQSLTHGEKPVIQKFNTPEDEMEFIVKEIKDLEAAGVPRKDICLVARTHKLINGYKDGLRNNGIDVFEITTNKVDDRSRDEVRIATMHRVKGLEFNYIFAAGVNNKALPNGVRSDFSDDVSLEEFETEEKCLLYVALTRARAGAYVTCYGTMSNLIV
ncbi:MAG: 3'-5' exonuclease [Acetatifactor sp.]